MFPTVIVKGLSGLLVVLLFFIGVQGLIFEDDGGTEFRSRNVDFRQKTGILRYIEGSCKINREYPGFASTEGRIRMGEIRDTRQTQPRKIDSREDLGKSRRFFTRDERRLMETRDTRQTNRAIRAVGRRITPSHEDQRRSLIRQETESSGTRFVRSENLRRNIKVENVDHVVRVDRRREHSKLDRNASEMIRERSNIRTRIERTSSDYNARRLEDNIRREFASKPLRENSAERYRGNREARIDNRRERKFNERNTLLNLNKSERLRISPSIMIRKENYDRKYEESLNSRDVPLNRRNSMNIRTVEVDRRAIQNSERVIDNIRSSRSDIRMDKTLPRRTSKRNILESAEPSVKARKENPSQFDIVEGSTPEKRVYQRSIARMSLPRSQPTSRKSLRMTHQTVPISFRSIETISKERRTNRLFRSASEIRRSSLVVKSEVSRRGLDRLRQFGNDRRQRQNSDLRQENNIDINGNRIDVVNSRLKSFTQHRSRLMSSSIRNVEEGSRRASSLGRFREKGGIAYVNDGYRRFVKGDISMRRFEMVTLQNLNLRRLIDTKRMRNMSSGREIREKMNRIDHSEGRSSYFRLNAERIESLRSRNGDSFGHSELRVQKSKLRQQRRHMEDKTRSTIEDSSRRQRKGESTFLRMRKADNHFYSSGRTFNKSVESLSERYGDWHGTIQMTLATILVGQWLLFRGENGKQRCILGNFIRNMQIF